MKEFKQIINNIALIFVIIFTMAIGIYTLVEGLVFKKNNMDFTLIIIAMAVILIVSVLLVFFFRNNHTSLFLQITLTYFLLTGIVYWFALKAGWFKFSRNILPILIFNVIGYIVIIWLLIITKKIELQRINRKLKEFKELKK